VSAGTEELRDLALSRLSLSDGQGQFDQPIFVGLDLDGINCQEDDGRRR